MNRFTDAKIKHIIGSRLLGNLKKQNKTKQNKNKNAFLNQKGEYSDISHHYREKPFLGYVDR